MKNMRLRFAPLIRVSTERTESRGESLKIQKDIVERVVASLSGYIPDHCWQYSGQEHATPDQERKLFNKLLADSSKDLFDAVIVSDPSRWSRDNKRSKEGLIFLRKNRIRFFISSVEYDLFNPDHTYMIGVGVEASEHQTLTMQLKSITTRIEKAKRGLPASKPWPSGRNYVYSDKNKRDGHWDIDEDFKKKIERAAKDFLDGDSIAKVAKRLGMATSTLRNIFRKFSGVNWYQNFNVDKFNVHKEIKTKVPRLLPKIVIIKLLAKLEANKTIFHGPIKNKYLLSRMIICHYCGCSYVGYTDKNGRQYYRHKAKDCIGQKSLLAERLDNSVFLTIYKTFGDKEKIEQAVKEAMPDEDELKRLEAEKNDLEKDRHKTMLGKRRLIRAITEGIISDDLAVQKEDRKIDEKMESLKAKIQKIESILEKIPSKEEIEADAMETVWLRQRWLRTEYHMNEMSFNGKRRLLQLIFFNSKLHGERLGIYLRKHDNCWTFAIKGVLINERGGVPEMDEQLAYAKSLLGHGYEDSDEQPRLFFNKYKLEFAGTHPNPVR